MFGFLALIVPLFSFALTHLPRIQEQQDNGKISLDLNSQGIFAQEKHFSIRRILAQEFTHFHIYSDGYAHFCQHLFKNMLSFHRHNITFVIFGHCHHILISIFSGLLLISCNLSVLEKTLKPSKSSLSSSPQACSRYLVVCLF